MGSNRHGDNLEEEIIQVWNEKNWYLFKSLNKYQ